MTWGQQRGQATTQPQGCLEMVRGLPEEGLQARPGHARRILWQEMHTMSLEHLAGSGSKVGRMEGWMDGWMEGKDLTMPLSSHPFHPLVFSRVFIVVDLTDKKWHPILIPTSYKTVIFSNFYFSIKCLFTWITHFILGCSYFLVDFLVIPGY